jgi:MscS family membrane protein
MTKEEAHEAEQRARGLLRRAEATLDLRQVPEALRQETGLEAVLLLKEVLDRMLPPPFDALPNEIMVAAAREGVSGPFLPAPGPLRWRLPNTEIEIVEIVDGDQQGQFLFSASSVARLRDSYQRVRDLPYRPAELGVTALEYRSPAISPGFYEYYISTPGYIVPRIHFLGGFLNDLPDAYQTLYADQALWQWVGLLLCLLLAAGAAILVFRLLGRLAQRLPSPVNNWLLVAAPAVVAVFVRWAVNVIATDLNVTGDVLAAVTAVGSALFAVLVVWAVFRFCIAIAETLIASPRVEDASIDASLVRVAARIVGFLVGAWVVVWSVRNLGVDVIPLLAGLGVGGLAVALAAQRTFANFIGSLILYVNRPVAVGDFCRYGDGQIGTVEEIGLLSTRIRSLERTIVTVPNADFSEMQLDNFARRDMRLFKTLLQLRYETNPEQLRYVLVKLRELLLGHPEVTPDPARVRFVELGEYSLDIEIFAYLRCQDQNTFLAIKEDLLLRIVDIVTEAGTSFAFPSAVEYRAPDKGVDVDRGRKAEAEVEQWRASGKLPFPEFEAEERERLEDVLDYPPKGSPHRERS